MVREVVRCPYCGRVSAELDDARVGLRVLGGRRGPCPHAAFVSVGVTGSDPAGRPDDALTWLWLWTRGRGLERLPRLTPLAEAVDLVACGIPVEGGPPLDAEYRAAGMTADERDDDAPGSGTVALVAPDGRAAEGLFDGHGLYAPDPAALVAALRRWAAWSAA